MNSPAALPMMDAPTARPQLTKRRKAAVVVQMLLADGQRLSLSRLPEDVQLDLTRELETSNWLTGQRCTPSPMNSSTIWNGLD